MVKLLIISVTEHTPQNRVSDIVPHVTLDTINDVDEMYCNFANTYKTKTPIKIEILPVAPVLVWAWYK